VDVTEATLKKNTPQVGSKMEKSLEKMGPGGKPPTRKKAHEMEVKAKKGKGRLLGARGVAETWKKNDQVARGSQKEAEKMIRSPGAKKGLENY